MNIAPALPLTLSLMALGGCDKIEGAVNQIRDTPAFEIIGLGPDLPCDVDRSEARKLTGAYLQLVDGSMGGTTFAISGRAGPSKAPLPRNLAIDDSRIWGVRADEAGALRGWRQSAATPIAALNTRQTLPLAYALSYRVDGVTVTGPLVAGLPPLQEDIPQLGQVTRAGGIMMTYTSVDDAGAVSVTEARGDFSMRIGFGSGRATFTANRFQVTSGPQMPFASLQWTQLGLCGARIVSSGQGIVSLFDADGTRLPTLGPDADPGAGTLVLESSQFAGSTADDGPTDIGGVFAIQGDTSSLTAVFLSRGPP
ncbi:hypothetical protein [Yoonia sp. BS5-3]|uniref:Transferrin-binding protein B C-lobe/N-lobe beta barrel domain-containing protein n=1 Tax=Yoonia phaeophyticola TaxID=3137369 RepID=A0ABZ3IDL9_9RHOB